jgi:LuxR family maltose regulon positive regulatory protein
MSRASTSTNENLQRLRALDREPVGGGDLGFQALGSRLRLPSWQVPLVPRDSLIESLLADRRALVLVCAPAGYGKSIALAQWLAADPRPGAWLQLDEADDDPVELLTYVALALGRVTSVDPAIFDLLRLREPPLKERILPGLAAAVEAAPPFLFVLDDAHLVSGEDSWQLLAALFRQLPDGAQVAVGTRDDPPLPLSRLRAAGRLAEYRAADLTMDEEEAKGLLGLGGIAMDATPLKALLAATEGWPAGLSLAMLAGQTQGTADWPLALRGDQRTIAAYLTEEVLERQPEDLQRFLLRTSVLERLCAGLCAAVCDDAGARELLARSARENLFVVALDDREEWFRYHHLFGELLRARLEQTAPEEVAELHRRASRWLEQHSDAEGAVRHALAAGEGAGSADLAAWQCDQFLLHGQAESARRLFLRFSDEQIGASASLALTAALLSVYVDDPVVNRWSRAVDSIEADDSPSPVGSASMRSWQVIMRAQLSPHGVAEMRENAALAWALEPPDSVWATHAGMLLGLALYFSGEREQAKEHVSGLLSRAQDADERCSMMALLGLIACDQGHWSEAVAIERSIQKEETTTPQLVSFLLHSKLLARRKDPGLSAYIAEAGGALRETAHLPTRGQLFQAVVLAESCLEADDEAGAARWQAQAEEILTTWPDAGELRERAERVRRALEARRISEPLTPAERRVLDLLTTHLTVPQIAARLFVTTNTVKSHMKHVYIKLGVTTRTTAVERGRELGLLGPGGD